MSSQGSDVASVVVSVGIDVGCESTKVVLNVHNKNDDGDDSTTIEIVRNEVGGHMTPTLVAFVEQTRFMGEAATAYKGSSNTVTHLNRLLLKEKENENEDPFQPFYRFAMDENRIVSVDYNGCSQEQFDSAALLAMFLGKIRHNVQATLGRILATDQEYELEYVIAVPSSQQDVKDAIKNAAYAVNMETVRVVDTSTCLAAAYRRKFENQGPKRVLVVDMGHAQTTVSTLSGDSDTVTNVQYHPSLGAGLMDIRLFRYFVANNSELKDVTPSSKAGYRLLLACSKLKHLLSQLPEGSVTVENINDKDVVLSATRTLLVEQCQQEHATLMELLETSTQEATFDSVEVLGGACRVPWVKETILSAVEGVPSLSHSFDDTSIALGAALLPRDSAMEQLEATERRLELRQAEEKMAILDEEMRKRAMVYNQIEAHVLEMRAAKHGKHGELLPTAALDAHLDQADDWLFSGQDVALKEAESKLESILNATRELCSDYFTAVQKEAEDKELEMNQEAKLAQAQAGDEEEEEDHDNRRLPKKRRMEIVQKNKKEANELFGDGNYRHAAARYAKALTHCSKFVDLSPDDKQEVNEVKLSLCLNLALAYIKLDMLDQALRCCNDALDIDPESTKALYRRGTVYYEKKQWDNANRDAQQAANVAPDDKAVQKLQARIDAQVKKQKAKEKKMAQKMFG